MYTSVSVSYTCENCTAFLKRTRSSALQFLQRDDPRQGAQSAAGAGRSGWEAPLPGASPPDLSQDDHEGLTSEALNRGEADNPPPPLAIIRGRGLAPTPLV